MLLMDGYGSHSTYKFLKYCADNKIITYFLPPHTTQLIQPLDVAVFGPYKHWHGEAIGDHNRLGLTAVTKVDFLDMLNGFRTKAMKTGTIQKAFRTSGIWPLNAQIVLDKIDVLETPPESEHKLDINTIFTTPQNVDQANSMLGAAIEDIISYDDAARRLRNAYHTMVVENSLLKDQIQAMTAAAKQQAELSQSRRQVP